jgi:hypothetical protein
MGVSLLADLLLAGRHFQSISTEEPVMSKVLAVMIAGLFAVGAYAQTKPAEVDPTGKARRDSRDARRPAKGGGKKPVPAQGTTPQ